MAVLADTTRAKTWAGVSSFDSTELAALATDADAFVTKETGIVFYSGTATSATEYHDGGEFFIQLDHSPVVAISSIQTVDTSGSVVKTYATTEYVLDSARAIIELRQTGISYKPEIKFPFATKNVKVIYTHGIATGDWRFSMASKAATLLVAADIMEINGASKLYSADGVSSYSVENLSASYGQGGPYATKIDRLRTQASAILKEIGGGQFGM